MRVFSVISFVCGMALATTLATTAMAQAGAGQTAKPPAGQTAKPPATQTAATPPAGSQSLSVAVKYTGKGVVDDSHELLIALLSTPTVGPDSRPIAMLPVTKNGGVASFTNVSTSPVYVLAVYDDKGTWDPRAGPPPAGTPMGWYMAPKTTVPAPVKPGAKVSIALTFDGTKKFGQ